MLAQDICTYQFNIIDNVIFIVFRGWVHLFLPGELQPWPASTWKLLLPGEGVCLSFPLPVGQLLRLPGNLQQFLRWSDPFIETFSVRPGNELRLCEQLTVSEVCLCCWPNGVPPQSLGDLKPPFTPVIRLKGPSGSWGKGTLILPPSRRKLLSQRHCCSRW